MRVPATHSEYGEGCCPPAAVHPLEPNGYGTGARGHLHDDDALGDSVPSGDETCTDFTTYVGCLAVWFRALLARWARLALAMR